MKTSCDIVAPVFLEYRLILTRFIQSRVKDPIDGEELLSEVMMKIYKNCEKLDSIRDTEAWLITIARNTINDYFREQKKRFSKDTLEPIIIENEPDILESLSKCIPGLINKLPVKYSQPLIQYEIMGIPQKELAVEYNMSESGLKSRVQRGRKMLKALFTECCGQLVGVKEDCDDCETSAC